MTKKIPNLEKKTHSGQGSTESSKQFEPQITKIYCNYNSKVYNKKYSLRERNNRMSHTREAL